MKNLFEAQNKKDIKAHIENIMHAACAYKFNQNLDYVEVYPSLSTHGQQYLLIAFDKKAIKNTEDVFVFGKCVFIEKSLLIYPNKDDLNIKIDPFLLYLKAIIDAENLKISQFSSLENELDFTKKTQITDKCILDNENQEAIENFENLASARVQSFENNKEYANKVFLNIKEKIDAGGDHFAECRSGFIDLSKYIFNKKNFVYLDSTINALNLLQQKIFKAGYLNDFLVNNDSIEWKKDLSAEMKKVLIYIIQSISKDDKDSLLIDNKLITKAAIKSLDRVGMCYKKIYFTGNKNIESQRLKVK